jgi:hypothetical protein
MLLLTLALAAVIGLPQTGSTECPRTTAHVAVDPRNTPPLRKLNELPPANMYSAVYRQVGGCEKPIVVRYNVGKG